MAFAFASDFDMSLRTGSADTRSQRCPGGTRAGGEAEMITGQIRAARSGKGDCILHSYGERWRS